MLMHNDVLAPNESERLALAIHLMTYALLESLTLVDVDALNDVLTVESLTLVDVMARCACTC